MTLRGDFEKVFRVLKRVLKRVPGDVSWLSNVDVRAVDDQRTYRSKSEDVSVIYAFPFLLLLLFFLPPRWEACCICA
jgi:hypothetical protein